MGKGGLFAEILSFVAPENLLHEQALPSALRFPSEVKWAGSLYHQVQMCSAAQVRTFLAVDRLAECIYSFIHFNMNRNPNQKAKKYTLVITQWNKYNFIKQALQLI